MPQRTIKIKIHNIKKPMIPILTLKQSASSLLLSLLSSLTLMLILTSCAGVSKLHEDIHNSRDDKKGNFIQTKDGTVVQGDDLKIRYPFLKKAYVQINQQDKVNLRDVEVMQNDAGYYRMINGALAPRIKKGGINTFLTYETRTTYSASPNGMGRTRTYTVPVYFLQKTDSGIVRRMSAPVVEEMVADYQPAMDFMDQYNETRRKARTWSWINTAAVIGGAVLMSSGVANYDGKATMKPQGYVGAGLFVGGIVSGVVNKVRKGNNYKNIELAIDEYNARSNRRRGR
jgi:hypothetical protein